MIYNGQYAQQEGVKLFYNNPEQYESHRNSVIDDNVKIEWHNKEHERRVREFNSTEDNAEGNGVWDGDASFCDIGNGIEDPGEPFIDLDDSGFEYYEIGKLDVSWPPARK